jgi:hypothetical protein
MEPTELNALSAAAVRLLRPLVRLLLRSGVSYKTFSNLVKWLFVDVAMKEFDVAGRKHSISHVSVITGLTRKEVARVLRFARPQDAQSAEKYNRAARVIAGWRRDPDFRDKRGAVAAIEFKGEGATFSALVRRYSGDMPPRALLDELLRTGSVKMLKSGRLKLVNRSYVPASDRLMKLHILGVDAGHLIATIEHNIRAGDAGRADAFFQRKVKYDNIPNEAMPQVRVITAEACQHLLEKLDVWLSTKDRDVNPQAGGEGRNVAGIGIYYFENPYDEEG